MPYSIIQNHPQCSTWGVVKDSSNRLMGCHKTKTAAQAQLTALNMAEQEKAPAPKYATRAAAERRASQIGCSGAHKMGDKWMPCSSHSAFERVTGGGSSSGGGYKNDLVFGPSGRIILQDLNVALSSNFKEMQKNRPMSNFVQNVEEYRPWIIDLLKNEHVVLVTARSVAYEDMTLERIKSETGWTPDDWCFNPWEDPNGKGALRAHRAKAKYLKEVIFPKYGDDPAIYFAIESNKFTRSMYKANGIECRDANRDDSLPWKTLLP